MKFVCCYSQAERTVQALRQSVEVVERRAVEVKVRAYTQLRKVLSVFMLLFTSPCVCVHVCIVYQNHFVSQHLEFAQQILNQFSRVNNVCLVCIVLF